jgi:hypothetical protein
MGTADEKRPTRLALGYGLAATAVLYTHYLAALLLLAQGLFAAAWFARRRQTRCLVALVTTGVAAAVAFLPWFHYVRGLRQTLYADAQMDWMPVPGAADAVRFLGREVFWGLACGATRCWPAATAVLPVLLAGVLALAMVRDRRAPESLPVAGLAYAVWLLAAPVALAIAASHLYRPVYFPPRFALLVLPAFLILAALACEAARPRWAGASLAGALAIAMTVGLVVQARAPLKTDWRGLAREWPRDAAPAELVCFPPYIAYCVSHYLGRPLVATDPGTVLRRLQRLAGAELWVVASADYPFPARPEDAASYLRLLAVGPRRTRLLAAAWRLDRVTVGPARTLDAGARADR